MLRRHLPAIAAIAASPVLTYRVRRYFALDSRPLILSVRGLSQADIVLCLVRIGSPRAREIAGSLIGKPITVAPACLLRWSHNKQTPSVGRQPMVTWVAETVPLRRGTRMALTFPEFKCGRTLQQLLMRGVSRADVRRVTKRGWVKMTEAVQ